MKHRLVYSASNQSHFEVYLERGHMKNHNWLELLSKIAARSGIVVFFIMAFEVMIMISPFAFFFYSVFNPVLHWLGSYSATTWLTTFSCPI